MTDHIHLGRRGTQRTGVSHNMRENIERGFQQTPSMREEDVRIRKITGQ
jgi:hypothetical protein